MMTYRTTAKVWALAMLCAWLSVGCAAQERRPNFLVILCDDLGYGDLGCYGHKAIKTPCLDRLATQGVRLTSCYSAAPVCSPSRAGLLTGRTPSRVGVYDWIPADHPMHLPAGEVTVARLLKRAGYATGHFGKWHCNGKFNSPDQPQPDDHGFDYWFSTQNNAAPSHRNPENFVRNGRPAGKLEGFSCQLVASETIRWLKRERAPDKPFFAFVCFHEPHEPVDSPDELVAMYPEATKKGEALYYANVTNMDRAVGELMRALNDMNLADDTLVWFTSDNGPETLDRYRGANRSHGSPGPLRGMKLHMYEGGIRVPGIMRWPGRIGPGSACDVPVSGVDVLPTLCALAGVDAPTDRVIDGTNIASIFDGRAVARSQPLFWHYYLALSDPKVAIRNDDWKLLAPVDGIERLEYKRMFKHDFSVIKQGRLAPFELYDVGRDIAERNDLAGTEQQRRDEMSRELMRLYDAVIEEGPTWPTSP